MGVVQNYGARKLPVRRPWPCATAAKRTPITADVTRELYCNVASTIVKEGHPYFFF